MARKERTSKGRTMIPNYFVFCEGDTEVVYVEMLRSCYRLPIHIIPKKTLLNVTPALVERCKATSTICQPIFVCLSTDRDVGLTKADWEMRYLSNAADFSVWEINAILDALDLSLRFEVVPA